MRALTGTDEILSAQHTLEQHFKEQAQPAGNVRRHPSYWISSLDIWASLNDELKGRRPWTFNLFGKGRPGQSEVTHVFEANTAHSDINRMLSGLFARDDDGKVCLLHKGKFNGLAMDVFWREYPGEQTPVEEVPNRPYAVVTRVGSSDLIGEIANFMNEVLRIKGLANNG